MLQSLIQDWWVFVLRGVVFILFGLFALFSPGIALGSLLVLFAVFAIIEGILAIVVAFHARNYGGIWWGAFFAGVLGIAVGILTFMYPHTTALTLLYLIAFWAIITGVLEIVAAVQLRKVIDNEWLLALGGLISIVFGVLLLARPQAGALAVVWIIGAYAIIFGIMLVVLGGRVKGLQHRLAAR